MSALADALHACVDVGLIGAIVVLAHDSIIHRDAITEARQAITFLRKALPRESLTSWDENDNSTVVGPRRALPGPEKTKVWSRNEPKLPRFIDVP
jgi:hypothetical protein